MEIAAIATLRLSAAKAADMLEVADTDATRRRTTRALDVTLDVAATDALTRRTARIVADADEAAAMAANSLAPPIMFPETTAAADSDALRAINRRTPAPAADVLFADAESRSAILKDVPVEDVAGTDAAIRLDTRAGADTVAVDATELAIRRATRPVTLASETAVT